MHISAVPSDNNLKGLKELYLQVPAEQKSEVLENITPPPSYDDCTTHKCLLQIKHKRIEKISIKQIKPIKCISYGDISTQTSVFNRSSSFHEKFGEDTNPEEHTSTNQNNERCVLEKYVSCRWRVAFLALSGLIMQIAHRNCISVAIVCMTKEVVMNVTTNGTVTSQIYKEYNWTSEMEGVILSSYFYGQIISPLISGMLCRHYGVRGPMTVYVFLSSCLLISTPFVAHYGAWGVIIIRSAQGFFGSGCLPMYSHLWSRWAPKQERSQLISFTFSGLDIGVIVAFTVSGWLCTLWNHHGWPLIFYVFGAISILWCVVWLFFFTDLPEENSFISKRELKYIMSERSSEVSKHTSTPWFKIFTSGPVFAMIMGMFTVAWGMTVVFSFLPKYMNDVLKYDIRQNGLFSSLPFLGRAFSIILIGRLTDYLLNRNKFKHTTMRKINQCGAGILGAAMIIPVSFLSEGDSFSAVMLITFSSMALGGTMSGSYANILEIFPSHVSTISGVAFAMNGIGQITAPIIIGQMIKEGSREEWIYVFISIGVVYIIGAIIYALLGNANSCEDNDVKITVSQEENIDTCNSGLQTISGKCSSLSPTNKQIVYSISECPVVYRTTNSYTYTL
ncbi:sialin-like [Mytilus edulis]|uniref:sialin-like n=1 Tax=Mytilus edulis TaxID=6550 RepID=UPI0039F1054A